MPAADWIAEKTTENIRRYAGIRQLCAEHGVTLSEDDQTQLDTRAEAHAIRHGGRSPRVAKQFIQSLKAQHE